MQYIKSPVTHPMKRPTPGPGEHQNMRDLSTFKVGHKPMQYQFFGSSCERFNHNWLEAAIKHDPAKVLGPGQYETRSDFSSLSEPFHL